LAKSSRFLNKDCSKKTTFCQPWGHLRRRSH
jgi:hypothetical protein